MCAAWWWSTKIYSDSVLNENKRKVWTYIKDFESYQKYTAQWSICVDLKMVNFLLGQQRRYTKYPCFFCFWNRKAKEEYYFKQIWPVRTSLTVGEKNVINLPLLSRYKVVFPTLYIKLGFIKQHVKSLDINGERFKYMIFQIHDFTIIKFK